MEQKPEPEQKTAELTPVPPEQQVQNIPSGQLWAAFISIIQERFPEIQKTVETYVKEREKSVRTVHVSTVAICGLIVAAAVIIALKSPNGAESAEKIIIPLITFLGGLLVGEKTKSSN